MTKEIYLQPSDTLVVLDGPRNPRRPVALIEMRGGCAVAHVDPEELSRQLLVDRTGQRVMRVAIERSPGAWKIDEDGDEYFVPSEEMLFAERIVKHFKDESFVRHLKGVIDAWERIKDNGKRVSR